MTTFYSPVDNFSLYLISSIPKKVYEWVLSEHLSGTGPHPDKLTNIAGLRVSFDLDEEWSYLELDSLGTVKWQGLAVNPENIMVSNEDYADCRSNIEELCDFESSVYLEVEKYLAGL